MIDRFDSGTFTPLPLHEFPISRVEDAMRLMGQAKHIGKVVVTMDDPAIVVAPSVGMPERAVVRGDATYLITGGLGGFGLLVAEWFAREGAGCIVLVGRSGAIGEAGEQVQRLRELRPGVRIEVMSADVSRAADVHRVFDQVRATMPPLRGVIHAAMVLDDVPLVELDRARLDRVLAPKMAGAWHLHQETLNESLEWFVMFSSLAAIIGNPYQANYCAANAFLDALAHERRALGLPGLSISWGMLSKAGYLSRHVDVANYLERQGYLPFTPAQAFEVLSALLRHDVSHLMAARVEWPRWLESSPAAAVSGILRQFAESAAERGAHGAAGRGEAGSLRATLLAASVDERRERVIAFLRETVCKVLGLSSSKLQNERPLTDLGFDSLMAVELITALSTRIGVEVAAVKLLQGMSVSALAALVLEELATERTASTATTAVVSAAKVPPMQERIVPEPAEIHLSTNGGSPHNGGAHHPSPAATNGAHIKAPSLAPSPYSTLDYSRPTNGLRALRGVVTLALRTVAKVDIEGLEHLPASGGCLLATNHLSAADLPVLFSVVQRRTVMYAAERLRSSTVLNWLFSEVGDTIYVRRGEHDTEALESGLAVLRAGGLLALSPEGTRSQTGALARGRTGVAYLAMLAGVPVVPIALWGQERMPARWRSMRRAPVMVRIGAPLRFSHREPDAARLRECADQVMQSIAELLPEEYRGVYGDRAALV